MSRTTSTNWSDGSVDSQSRNGLSGGPRGQFEDDPVGAEFAAGEDVDAAPQEELARFNLGELSRFALFLRMADDEITYEKIEPLIFAQLKKL